MIGLGQIGLPLAVNLMKAGHTVVGFRRGSKDEFVAAGGVAAKSPREVIERCETVLSCLPYEESLAEVVSGQDGLASSACEGRLLIELSTLDTAGKARQADALRSRGAAMLDCSISGIPRMVQDRMGVVYVSGDEALYAKSKDLFDAISSKVFFVGPFGAALQIKLCANMLVALNIAATAETLAFAVKLGLDPARTIEALKDGAGGSLQFTARAKTMSLGDWNVVRGSTAMLTKDVHLIRKKADDVDCPTPLLSSAEKIYDAAMESGLAEKDVASIYAKVAEAAKIPVPQSKSGK
ncbi:MAG: NAD(P)-dependent oxidoreductase [Xanthobacteraceae bacterium]